MQITRDKVTEIFYLADEFCQEFSKKFQRYQIGNKPKKPPRMVDSEVITILILFHFGGFRNLKHFYLYYVQKHMGDDFPNTVSYNRFVELSRNVCMPMTLFLKTCCLEIGRASCRERV